jgi:hypothetical protein
MYHHRTRAPCYTRDASRPFNLSIMATPDSIAHVLTSTLNPDSNVRIAAELNLSELLKKPRKLVCSSRVPFPLFSLDRHHSKESALSLAQLALSQDAESSLRQMSIICFVIRAHATVLDERCCVFALLCFASRLALGDYRSQEVREGTLVSGFPTI